MVILLLPVGDRYDSAQNGGIIVGSALRLQANPSVSDTVTRNIGDNGGGSGGGGDDEVDDN